jgi:hypothetical protein
MLFSKVIKHFLHERMRRNVIMHESYHSTVMIYWQYQKCIWDALSRYFIMIPALNLINNIAWIRPAVINIRSNLARGSFAFAPVIPNEPSTSWIWVCTSLHESVLVWVSVLRPCLSLVSATAQPRLSHVHQQGNEYGKPWRWVSRLTIEN